MEIKFNFKFSDRAIAAHFTKTGEKLDRDASVTYDGKDFSEAARESLSVINPNLLNVRYPEQFVGVFDSIPLVEEVQVRILEEAVKIIESRKAEAEKLRDDTIAQTLIVEQLEALSDEVLPEALKDSDLKSWQCVKLLRDRLIAIETRSTEIVKARELAAKAVIKAERLAWIDQHGSDRLKRGVQAGHNCQRLYVEERSVIEYPGFDLDYSDNLVSKDRSCPSVNALDELDRYPMGRIVWVKKRHDRDSEEYYEDDYDGEEAIVIEDYLGNNTLVKYLGDPQDQ